MNIIICDGKLSDANNLSDLIKRLYPSANITVFEDADVLHNANNSLADILFINAHIPKVGGVALSHALQNSGCKSHIVFCSDTKEYAHDAFCAGAVSYLLKPVTLEAIENLFKRIENLHRQGDTSCITTKTINGFASIPFHEIAYVEVILHNVYFNLLNGSVLIINSALKEIAHSLFVDNRFLYCHRSYIVNIDAILHLNSNEITLKNNKTIPISRTYYPKLQKIFLKNSGALTSLK